MLLNIGEKARFFVSGRDDSNREADIPSSPSFSVANESVCSITDDGVVTALGIGQTSVTAAVGEFSTQVNVEVKSKALSKIIGVLQRV